MKKIVIGVLILVLPSAVFASATDLTRLHQIVVTKPGEITPLLRAAPNQSFSERLKNCVPDCGCDYESTVACCGTLAVTGIAVGPIICCCPLAPVPPH